MILEKEWQLGGNGFWKASRLYFKTLQSFAWLTLLEKRDKGFISEILMRNLPHIMIFSPKISEKGCFGISQVNDMSISLV